MVHASPQTEREQRVMSVHRWNEDISSAETLVIIPTYNENENIRALLRALTLLVIPIDILVADDNSPDGTAETVAAMAPNLPRRIYLMRRKGKFGLGVCYLDAFRYVEDAGLPYTCIVQMDADFSHPPDALSRMLPHVQTSGLVVGSRYTPGGSTPDWNQRRVTLSKAGNLYARTVLRLFAPAYPVRDNTAGFMAWRRDVLHRVISRPIFGDGYSFLTVLKFIAFRLGYPAQEVPICFRDRRLGVSKLNRHIILEAFLMPWRLGWKFRMPIN